MLLSDGCADTGSGWSSGGPVKSWRGAVPGECWGIYIDLKSFFGLFILFMVKWRGGRLLVTSSVAAKY